jgi:cytochrome c-type biogenesis protein CcmH
VPWLALAVLVLIAGTVLAARSGPSSSPTARAERLNHELACPVCNGEAVADSNAPESRAIRTDIVRRIRAGESDSEIRAAYVESYTEKILLTPSNRGIGIVAWGIPIVALVLGGAGIAFAVRRWSTTPRLAATADDEDVVNRERRRDESDPDGGDDA